MTGIYNVIAEFPQTVGLSSILRLLESKNSIIQIIQIV